MSNLDKMWEALEKYQPYADKYGFGEAWLRMTTERTSEAAERVAWMAWAGDVGAAVVHAAWDAAHMVVDAARTEAAGTVWAAEEAERVISYITRAIEQENKNEC